MHPGSIVRHARKKAADTGRYAHDTFQYCTKSHDIGDPYLEEHYLVIIQIKAQ